MLAAYEELGVSPEQLKEIDTMFSEMAKELAEYKEKCPKLDIHRKCLVEPTLDEWIKKVEDVLGFKLFIWQRTYIENGIFRCYGETTAKILRELSQINKPPINLFEHKRQGRMQRIYCGELMKIKEKLDAAGVQTRQKKRKISVDWQH